MIPFLLFAKEKKSNGIYTKMKILVISGGWQFRTPTILSYVFLKYLITYER